MLSWAFAAFKIRRPAGFLCIVFIINMRMAGWTHIVRKPVFCEPYGWLMVENCGLARPDIYEHYAKDILADRFYLALERNLRWVQIVLLSWVAFFIAGAIGASAMGHPTPEVLRVGAPAFLCGVCSCARFWFGISPGQ